MVSLALARAGFDIALVEPGCTGAANAKRRGLETVICATADTAEFKPHSLSAIGLFDVVEHIEDDFSFLRSLRGLMKEKGRLYITVPAYSFLCVITSYSIHYTKLYDEEYLEKGDFSETDPGLLEKHSILQIPRSVFVTLKKSGQLRGCIGDIISPNPLHENIQLCASYNFV